MSRSRTRLAERFRDKAYRDAYAESFLNTSIAAQIRSLREKRGWRQAQLGERVGMKQSQISRMESVNNDAWSVKSLLRLAKAFDVTLAVRFESFGTLADAAEALSLKSLERPSFNEDPAFKDVPPTASTAVERIIAVTAVAHEMGVQRPVETTAQPFQLTTNQVGPPQVRLGTRQLVVQPQ